MFNIYWCYLFSCMWHAFPWIFCVCGTIICFTGLMLACALKVKWRQNDALVLKTWGTINQRIWILRMCCLWQTGSWSSEAPEGAQSPSPHCLLPFPAELLLLLRGVCEEKLSLFFNQHKLPTTFASVLWLPGTWTLPYMCQGPEFRTCHMAAITAGF